METEKMQLPTMSLAIILGLIGTLMLNMGKGIAKFAINKRKETSDRKRLFYTGIWGIGLTINIFSVFFTIAATGLGVPSIIAALGGIGLTSVVIFSFFVLKEKLGWINYVGIIIIVIATVIVGISTSEIPTTTYNVLALFPFILITSIVFIPLIMFSIKRDYLYFGIIFGSFSGLIGGFALVLLKIFLIEVEIPGLFFHGLAIGIVALIISLVGLFLTQYGLTKAKANLVNPSFNSFYILIPLLCEFVIFFIVLNPFQIVGIACICIGIVLMTGFEKESPEKS